MSHCHAHRALLAQGPICNVEQCSCGVIHVTIGPLTLRLEPDVIVSLKNTLEEAIERLDARRQRTLDGPPLRARPS